VRKHRKRRNAWSLSCVHCRRSPCDILRIAWSDRKQDPPARAVAPSDATERASHARANRVLQRFPALVHHDDRATENDSGLAGSCWFYVQHLFHCSEGSLSAGRSFLGPRPMSDKDHCIRAANSEAYFTGLQPKCQKTIAALRTLVAKRGSVSASQTVPGSLPTISSPSAIRTAFLTRSTLSLQPSNSEQPGTPTSCRSSGGRTPTVLGCGKLPGRGG